MTVSRMVRPVEKKKTKTLNQVSLSLLAEQPNRKIRKMFFLNGKMFYSLKLKILFIEIFGLKSNILFICFFIFECTYYFYVILCN